MNPRRPDDHTVLNMLRIALNNSPAVPRNASNMTEYQASFFHVSRSAGSSSASLSGSRRVIFHSASRCMTSPPVRISYLSPLYPDFLDLVSFHCCFSRNSTVAVTHFHKTEVYTFHFIPAFKRLPLITKHIRMRYRSGCVPINLFNIDYYIII